MKYQKKMVTPEYAKKLLEMNTGNFRRLSQHTIKAYARDMAAGEWELNGETIKLNGDTLLDGQHRLHAVIQSGATVPMLIVRDVEASAMYIDRGRTRTVAHWLDHLGLKNTKNVAAVGNRVLQYRRGLWRVHKMKPYDFSDGEVVALIQEHYEGLSDAIRMAQPARKILAVSTLASIVFIGGGFNPKDDATAQWFCAALTTGEGLKKTDPALLLRNRLLQEKDTKQMSVYMRRMLATLAWNKTAAGEQLKALGLRLTGPRASDPLNDILLAADLSEAPHDME